MLSSEGTRDRRYREWVKGTGSGRGVTGSGRGVTGSGSGRGIIGSGVGVTWGGRGVFFFDEISVLCRGII